MDRRASSSDGDSRLRQALREHAFAQDLSERHFEILANHAHTVEFDDGQYLWRQGDLARHTYLLVDGSVALEIAVPHQGRIPFDVVVGGEVAGCSALFSDTRWGFDARAVARATSIALAASGLRASCEHDHELGYRLLQRCAQCLGQRLDASHDKLIAAHGAALP